MTRYLRVVVTPRCPLACTYCHQEGDPATRTTLTTDELTRLLALSVSQGIRKIKFLGGEPLVRADLPDIIRFLSALDPTLDVSVITSGALPVARLKACFDAGLTRANMSIHGWTQDAFARNRGLAPHYQNRNENLQYLLEQGRFLKLNSTSSSRNAIARSAPLPKSFAAPSYFWTMGRAQSVRPASVKVWAV